MLGFTLPRVPERLTAEIQRPALPVDPAVRAAAAIGLITVGIIHVLEIQGQLSGAAWLTAGFVLLAACAPVAGLWLLARPSSVAWGFSGLVCVLAAGGYILTRSVPVIASIATPGRRASNTTPARLPRQVGPLSR